MTLAFALLLIPIVTSLISWASFPKPEDARNRYAGYILGWILFVIACYAVSK
jgi:hypothetical protein